MGAQGFERTDSVLANGGGCFRLEQLTDGILGDVVQADAQFQLQQRAFWRWLSGGMRELESPPGLDPVDVLSDFGRLGHLGLTGLELALDLELCRLPWWRRVGRWVARRVGRAVTPVAPTYRLARSPRRTGLRLQVRVARHADGRYGVEAEPPVKDGGLVA